MASRATPAATLIPLRLGRGLALAVVGLLALAACAPLAPAAAPGSPRHAFHVLDAIVADLIRRWEIPGGAVAVVHRGRLVHARGYGVVDADGKEPVRADALFRIASLSKPITAVAVLKLVQDKRLDLDAPAFELLGLKSEGPRDPRLGRITVRHLLLHAGGWDREKSFDPMGMPWTRLAAVATDSPTPASCHTVIRYMLTRRLDFDPGARSAYSNFGYCVLGRVIEAVTGASYEEFVRGSVLAPMGIQSMRLGRSRPEDRADGEVRYHEEGSPTAVSVFDGTGTVPLQYGGFFLESMDAHGGWIGSVVDLARFIAVVEGTRGEPFLNAGLRALMLARPAFVPRSAPSYFAMGWQVRPVGRGANWWHSGALPGTVALLVHAHDGHAWAAVFNGRPRSWMTFLRELDAGLWRGATERTELVDRDLFPSFGGD